MPKKTREKRQNPCAQKIFSEKRDDTYPPCFAPLLRRRARGRLAGVCFGAHVFAPLPAQGCRAPREPDGPPLAPSGGNAVRGVCLTNPLPYGKAPVRRPHGGFCFFTSFDAAPHPRRRGRRGQVILSCMPSCRTRSPISRRANLKVFAPRTFTASGVDAYRETSPLSSTENLACA